MNNKNKSHQFLTFCFLSKGLAMTSPKRLTLILLRELETSRILLGMKKRGFGAGRQ